MPSSFPNANTIVQAIVEKNSLKQDVYHKTLSTPARGMASGFRQMCDVAGVP